MTCSKEMVAWSIYIDILKQLAQASYRFNGFVDLKLKL